MPAISAGYFADESYTQQAERARNVVIGPSRRFSNFSAKRRDF